MLILGSRKDWKIMDKDFKFIKEIRKNRRIQRKQKNNKDYLDIQDDRKISKYSTSFFKKQNSQILMKKVGCY